MNSKTLGLVAAGLVAELVTVPVADAGTFTTDFGSGLPAGSSIYNNAVIDSGVLKLTNAVNSSAGQFYVNDLDGGQAVTQLRVAFKMLIGGGNTGGQPADGISLSFASDLPSSPSYGNPGEEGAGSGLRISFDTWANNPSSDPIAIDVFYGGVLKGRVPFQSSQGSAGNAFYDVVIDLKADGTLDLSYGFFGTNPVFSALQTGYTPISGGQFAFAARTGGFADNQWIDDLSITTTARAAVPEPGTLALLGLGLAGLGFTRRRKA